MRRHILVGYREQFDRLVDELNQNQPFSLARYGDGEFAAAFQTRPGGCNCDHHRYFPEMGLELCETLDAPLPYYYALQIAGVMRNLQGRVEAKWPDIPWWNTSVFHYASMKGYLFPLVEALRKKRVLLVGPEHLGQLDFINGGHVVIPPTNCYLEKDRIITRIKGMIQSRNPQVIAFSASMLTCVLIHNLYPLWGKTRWLIDFGSLWEPYAGQRTRRYHNLISPELAKKNLQGE